MKIEINQTTLIDQVEDSLLTYFKKDDIKVLMKCGMGRFCFLKNSLLTFSPFKLIIKIKIFNVRERRGERKA